MLSLWIDENYPEIKVVLTSGFTKRRAEVEAIDSLHPLIRKPYTIETLAQQISERLSNGAAR